MEWAGKALGAVSKGSNNNLVINTFLVGAFVALSIRSMNQQKEIQSLEAERDSLLKANKSMKKSMWDWKQQLLAEAATTTTTTTDASTISLSKLKSIYGESPITQQGATGVSTNEDSKLPPSKFVV